MLKKLFYTLVIIIWTNNSFAQASEKSDRNDKYTLNEIEKIFILPPYEPISKENLKSFLTKNINIDPFLQNMGPDETLFADTANIKFILSRKGEFKEILFSKAKDSLFKYEILRLFKLSTGKWNIAQQSGRSVNAYLQFEIYFQINRSPGEIKINIDYEQIEPPY